MVASRNRPKGGRFAPFGLGVLALLLMTDDIGQQDLAALIARQPALAEQARDHGIASPFSAIQVATFSFPQISTAMPASLGYMLAGLDTSNADITGSIRDRVLGNILIDDPSAGTMPVVDRTLKGSRLDAPSQDAEPSPSGLRPDRRLKGDRLDARPEFDPPPLADLPPAQASTETTLEPHDQPAPAKESEAPPTSPQSRKRRQRTSTRRRAIRWPTSTLPHRTFRRPTRSTRIHSRTRTKQARGRPSQP